MGVVQYLGQAYMTEEILAALPQADQDYYHNMPAWVTGAFAIAVFAGAFGSLGLVLKKKWSLPLLQVSLLAVIAQLVYNFFLQDYIDLSGSRMAMPIVILLIALFLVWFAKSSKDKGWLS
jgi:hypothetical protein